MIKIPVKLQNSYNILLGENCLKNIGTMSKDVCNAKKVVIITDSNVKNLYLKQVKESFLKVNYEVFTFSFNAGEKSKTVQTYLKCVNEVAKAKLTRQDLIVALGGGVVGDIAGFVASTYMRGINFIQVPTTLLAVIDSSIGGKTGVDLKQGKNLLGAFYQPKMVFFDIKVLDTLPTLEWQNGLGEGLKYAILMGGECFDLLDEGLSEDNIMRFIELCATYKKQIVENDEKEAGDRILLNLGHTIGHAVENLSNYQLTHGKCVAIGVLKMAIASNKNGKLKDENLKKIIRLLDFYNFDEELEFTIDEIVSKITMDKKLCSDGKIKFVDIEKIGKCKAKTISLEEFKEYIK